MERSIIAIPVKYCGVPLYRAVPLKMRHINENRVEAMKTVGKTRAKGSHGKFNVLHCLINFNNIFISGFSHLFIAP